MRRARSSRSWTSMSCVSVRSRPASMRRRAGQRDTANAVAHAPARSAQSSASFSSFGSAAMRRTVLIVEDDREVMRRFADAVTADTELRLLGCVGTLAGGRALLDAQPPDVMLVDLGLPAGDGVDLIRHAAKAHPACDVLVVTMFGDDAHVLASLQAGATCYLLKDAGADRIAACIHEVRAGGSPISPSIA